jgi:hypothetical protein
MARVKLRYQDAWAGLLSGNRRLCAAPPLLRRSGRDLRLSKERHDPARGVAGFTLPNGQAP